MKRSMHGLIRLLCLGLLLLASGSHAAQDSGRPLAVWFYADWCTSCKLIAPKYEAARSGLDERIQFVKLDVTDDAAKAKTREMAAALGISPLYFANHETGWVALLNARHEQVGELRYDLSIEDMRARLEKLAPAP